MGANSGAEKFFQDRLNLPMPGCDQSKLSYRSFRARIFHGARKGIDFGGLLHDFRHPFLVFHRCHRPTPSP